MALRTLWDSPILAPLARAADRVGLELEVFGSVATRALLFDSAEIRVRDLFELVEHVSDIDIGHNGPAWMTLDLEAAIIQEVPSASWFRWSILDRDGMAERRSLQKFNIDVPLRNLRLGTKWRDSAQRVNGLLSRALRGDVDILPNEAFGASPRAGFDTEASAGLLYIDVAVDVLEVQARAGRRLAAPSNIRTRELINEGVRRLGELSESGRSIAMRRLWYRLASTAVRMPPVLFEAAADFFDLHRLLGLLDEAGFPVDSLGRETIQPILISGYLGDDRFRTPLTTGAEDGFGDWGGALAESLASFSVDPFSIVANPVTLAPGNQVVAAIRSVSLRSGVAPSVGSPRLLKQDFLHISLPIPRDLRELDAEQLTAIVIGHGDDGPALLPTFAVASVQKNLKHLVIAGGSLAAERCTIRLNLAGQIEGLEKIDVYLVRGDAQ